MIVYERIGCIRRESEMTKCLNSVFRKKKEKSSKSVNTLVYC